MSQFIQSLESRMLMAASAATLATDLGNVNTLGATVKADLTALQAGAKTDLAAITADLKGNKTSAAQLKTLKLDEAKYLAKIKADVTAMLKASSTATRGAKDGTASIATPTNVPLSNKVAADVAALTSMTTTPLGNLTLDVPTGVINTDLGALTGANPTNTGLGTHASTALSHLNTLSGKLLTDATQYSGAVGTLKGDLGTLLPVPTVTPSLIGDYQGKFKTKAIAFGLGSTTVDFEIHITAQTINSVTGSITAAGQTASGTITATELSNGKVKLDINNSGFEVKLNGVVNVNPTGTGLPPGSVITGSGTVSIAGFDIDGSFTVTKVS